MSTGQINIILVEKEEEVKEGEESIIKIMEKVGGDFWLLMEIIVFTWKCHV